MPRAFLRIALAATVLTCMSAAAAQAPGPENEGAQAAEEQRARELYVRGDRLYLEGNYEEAATAFQEAYRLSKRPVLLHNMANALERLGRYEEALQRLREFFPHASEEQKVAVRRRIDNLQKRVDEQVDEQRRRREEKAPEQAQEPKQEQLGLSTQLAPPPESDVPYLGYTLIGVGVVAAGLGTVFALASSSAGDDAESGCRSVGGQRFCEPQAQEDMDREKSMALGADISFGAGLVSAVVGAILVVTHDGSSERAPTTALRAGYRPGGGEVSVFTRF